MAKEYADTNIQEEVKRKKNANTKTSADAKDTKCTKREAANYEPESL